MPSNDILKEEEGKLVIDIYETSKDFVVEAPAAGVIPEDIEIEASRDKLFIKGKRIRPNFVPEKDFIYQECFWGIFSRSIILPQEIDPSGVSAGFKNSVLIINLPKAKKSIDNKRVKINVEK